MSKKLTDPKTSIYCNIEHCKKNIERRCTSDTLTVGRVMLYDDGSFYCWTYAPPPLEKIYRRTVRMPRRRIYYPPGNPKRFKKYFDDARKARERRQRAKK